MKKLFILPAAFLFAGVVANAQNNGYAVAKANMEIKDAKAEKKEAKKELRQLESGEPGVMVKDHFYQDFGDVKASWERTKYFDEGTFTQDGKTQTAYYDSDAELVGTTSLSSFAEIPASAQKDIQKHYKEYKVDKVILFNDNESNPSDMVLYGSAVSDNDNYFVELSKAGKAIVLKVNMEGAVSFFSEKK